MAKQVLWGPVAGFVDLLRLGVLPWISSRLRVIEGLRIGLLWVGGSERAISLSMLTWAGMPAVIASSTCTAQWIRRDIGDATVFPVGCPIPRSLSL